MAINKNSNTYIIIYTVVMVVIVGTLLAVLATSWKDEQNANVLNEQKVSIMKAFGEADANFNDMVKIGLVTEGEFTEVAKDDKAGVQAVFDLLGNRKALKEATAELPIFVLEKDGATKYVLPIVGKGLWGDIWGYVSLQQTEDNVVITGIVMDHAGETPGLGAEIASEKFTKLFDGKSLFSGNEVLKTVKGRLNNEAVEVNSISGATITCNGVNAMLDKCLNNYKSYLAGKQSNTNVESVKSVEE